MSASRRVLPAVFAISILLVAGCSSDGDGAETTNQATPVATPATASPSDTPAETGESTDTVQQTPATCTSTKDLQHSAFGRWMHAGQVPFTGGGAASFEVAQNCYDPSRELSWAVLHLQGSPDGYAVILLRHGDTMNHPAPVIVTQVDGVERISDTELVVTSGGKELRYTINNGQVTASGELTSSGPEGASLDLSGKNYRGPR